MKRPASPLTMRAHLNHCWLFTWRTPIATARALLPAPLEPVTHGEFAFWNVVVSEVQSLRPAPLPAAIGLSYWHVAYRLHARARLATGEWVEGLYFLRSDCDRRVVALPGNWLTPFQFHLARIEVNGEAGSVHVPDAEGHFRLRDETPTGLTPGSPFASVAEAAEFLKYKPCALAPAGPNAVEIVRVRRHETDWRYRIVTPEESVWQYLTPHEIAPEVCYAVEPIDYEWARGEVRATAA